MPKSSLFLEIECLRCGTIRRVKGIDHAGECGKCGDVGWDLPGRMAALEQLALRYMAQPSHPATSFSAVRMFRGGHS